MKKFALLVIYPILAVTSIQGQGLTDTLKSDTTKYWKIKGNTALNFSQVSLSNWAEGGEESLAGTFLFGITADKKKNKHTWNNTFSFEFGLNKNGNQNFRKSIDQIYLSSKYGYQIRDGLSLSALFDYRSQAAKGYHYPNDITYISSFMAPGYINVAAGLDYKPFPGLSIMLSPASIKLTFVLDDSLSAAGAFGVDPGNKIRAEWGPYLKTEYIRKNLVENVDIHSRLDLFSNYLHEAQNIDINFDLKLDLKINKFLSANLGTTLKYDNDVKYIDGSGLIHGARTQVKQFSGIGILLKF